MMFFEDSEVQTIADSHVSKIEKLEESEATRILKTYKRVRQDLRDRLDVIPAGTFTAQKMQGTLLQIQAAIDAMSARLLDNLSDSAENVGGVAIDHLVTEIQKLEKYFRGAVIPINLDAVRIANETKNFLFNQYEVSMDAYSADLRSRMAQGLSDAVLSQAPFSEVVSSIGKTFMGEEWRLLRLVRTELHNIYGNSKLAGMRELWGEGEGEIPDLKKALFQPMDSRTAKDSIYADKLKLVVPIDEPFRYKWKGKIREFQSPPDRPNDRSVIVPYRQGWGDQ